MRFGIAAVILVPLLGLFWDCVGPQVTYYGHDLALQQIPFARLARESLARGEWPFWNPDIFAGTPLLASGNSGVLTPLFLLTAPLPLGPAITVQAILAVALAYAGAAWLAWRRTRDPAAAALAGVVYALSAPVFMRVFAGHPHILQALAVMPWLLGAGEALATGSGARAAAGVAVCTAVMLCANAQVAYLGVASLGVILAVRLLARARPWRTAWARFDLPPLGWAAAGLLVGGLLAMPQILPALEFAGESTRRGGYPLNDCLWGSLAPHHVKYALVPLADGHPERGTGPVVLPGAGADGEVPIWELCGYVGIFGLAFAGVAWAAGRGRVYGCLAGVALLLALGRTVPLYAAAHFLLPKFDLFRVPGRLLCLVALGVAVCAGEGLAALRAAGADGDRTRRRARWVAAAVGVVALWAGTVAAGARADADAPWLLWLPVVAFGGLALGVGVAADAVRPLLVGAPALAALELSMFHVGFVHGWAVDQVQLPDATAATARALGREWRFDATNDAVYRPNVPVALGLRTAGGYDPAVLRRYMQLYNFTNGQDANHQTYAAWREQFVPPVQLLGLRYLISHAEYPAPMRRLHTAGRPEGPGPVHLYEYPLAMPRALVMHRTRIVDDSADDLAHLRLLQQPDFPLYTDAVVPLGGPALDAMAPGPSTVFVTAEAPRRVVVDATLAAPGLLVLLDSWYPGWSATVDGAPTAVHRVDHCFRGVEVPAGRHVVAFTYASAPFERGVGLALLGLLGVGVLWWVGRTRRVGAVTEAALAE